MAFEHHVIGKRNYRRLLKRLDEHPLVESFTNSALKIRVRYVTGVGETWYKKSVNPRHVTIPFDPFVGRDVVVHSNYEHELLGDEELSKMYIIKYSDWMVGNFISKHLVVQDMLNKFQTEGFIQLKFAQQDLISDLKDLWDSDMWRAHVRNDALMVYGFYSNKYYPGRKIIEHFTEWNDISHIVETWGDMTLMFNAMRRILSYGRDVTRHSLMCSISNFRDIRRSNWRFVCPNLYRLIMQKFELNGKVIADPNPGLGYKAVAATMERNVYHSSAKLDKLGLFLGTKFGDLDREQYDCVLLDYEWLDPGYDKIVSDLKHWVKRADMMIVFVPSKYAASLPVPTSRMKIKSKLFQSDNDWVYCYS